MNAQITNTIVACATNSNVNSLPNQFLLQNNSLYPIYLAPWVQKSQNYLQGIPLIEGFPNDTNGERQHGLGDLNV